MFPIINHIAVKCNNVSKSFVKNKESIVALDNISFEVLKGEIFGIIGPDGAGKSTLFRILTTLILPDNGIVKIEGKDVIKEFKAIRKTIGYMPGRFSLYQDLTVEENLNVFAKVYNTSIEENYYLIEDIYKQIEPFKDRRAGKLSGGMKQKLALSCALIHKPTVLFLDEPTTGVDPVSRKELWEMLKRLKEQGITILVSTPFMDEASKCDRIALMQHGQFLQVDTPEHIIGQFSHDLWAIRSDNMSNLLNDLRAMTSVKTSFAFGESHHVTFKDNLCDPIKLKTILQSMGHTSVSIEQIEATVEDCFMDLTFNY